MSVRHIKDFCTSPNPQLFRQFPSDIQQLFYKVSTDAVEHDYGNIDLAKKIIPIYLTRNMPEDAKRGLRTAIASLNLLAHPEVHKLQKPFALYPRVVIIAGEADVFKIQYGSDPDLPEMYHIVENHLTIPRDFHFYKENAKEYLIDTIASERVNITDIYVDLAANSRKLFYSRTLGVTWPESAADCLRCAATLHSVGIDCDYDGCPSDTDKKLKKLYRRIHPDKGGDPTEFATIRGCAELVVDDECLEEIKHHPDNINYQLIQNKLFL